MISLPRVSVMTRERVAREFDELGPTIATAQIIQLLEHANPELLDMLNKGARDIGDTARITAGFCMFYRLLLVEASTAVVGRGLHPLPRVALETRMELVRKIDQYGVEGFVIEAIGRLERDNPELLQMAHRFAETHRDYLRVMQGFALIYQALTVQLSSDRQRMH
jgi:hypothetical protein